MNSMPSIELQDTYLEQDTTNVHPNLSCQHHTVLTDRTFHQLPKKRKLSSSHLSIPKQTIREAYNSASVTTADMTEYRSSLQEYTMRSHLPHSVNILEKDETKHVEPSQEISDHESQEKSLSMAQEDANQVVPMINTDTVIPSDLYADHTDVNDVNDNNEANNADAPPPIAIIENPPAFEEPLAIQIEQQENANPIQQSQIAIRQAIEFYILLGCIYSLVFLALKGLLPYSMLLAFVSLVCSVKVIINLTHRDLHARYHKILDWLSLSMICFSALMRTVVPDLPLIPFVFPGFICTFLFWKISQPRTFYLKKENLVALRFLFWTQLLLITLKIDGDISSWNFVFLMLFYIFVFIMSFSVGLFLIAIVYFCQTLRQRSLDHTIIGLLWDFLNTLFAWIWGFGILHLINKLEGYHSPFLSVCVLLGLLHVTLLAVYTAVFKDLLAAHLETTLGGSNDGRQMGNQRYIFETVRENIACLVRVSSTYFTRMDEGLETQDRQQVQEWRQQIGQAKMNKHLGSKWSNKDNNHNDKQAIEKPKLVSQLNENVESSPFNGRSLYIKNSKSGGFDDIDIPPKMCCYSQDDIDIRREVKRPCLKNGKSEEGTGESQCVVCFSADPNAVFMDCGHGGICYDCALEVWRRGDNCVFCRHDIMEILRISNIPGMDLARVIEGTKRNVVFD